MTARCVGAALVLFVCALGITSARASARAVEPDTPGVLRAPPGIGDTVGFATISPDLIPSTPAPTPGLVLAPEAESSDPAPAPSGLAWRSGAGCWDRAFDRFRSRPSDVYVAFVGREKRRSVIRAVRSSYTGGFAKRPGRYVLSFPMLTSDIAGQFAQCSRGSFDNYVKDVANALRKHKIFDPIIRLGWEPNGTFAWSLGKWPGRDRDYVQCFRRQATIFRSRLPQAQIEWTNRRGNALPYSVERIYPGDAYVDIIGLMVYDRWPVHDDQRSWMQAYWMRDKFGGPKGLGTYLQMARDHRKKLAISEWAVSNNRNDPSSFDNPFFIERMHDFFRSAADDIAYEAYFNCGSFKGEGSNGGYRLSPKTVNPRTAAAYKRNWRR
jgi:hypothetical protein